MNRMHRLAARAGSSATLARRSSQVIRVDLLLRRISGGRLTLRTLVGLPEVFLTVPSRGTGRPRTCPVVGVPSNGGWLVLGSVWGRAGPPEWVADLIESGAAHVEHRGRHATVVPRLLEGPERAGAWDQLVRAWPPVAAYAERDPDVRIFFLDPSG